MENYHPASKRLIIRKLIPSDADDIFEYRSDSEANKYQGWIPTTINDVHHFITHKISPEINLPGTWVQFAIIKKDDDKLIGDIGIHFLTVDEFQVEIGCTLNKKFQGKGYATEALKATISYLFEQLGKRRIIASIDPRNQPSIKLFERLGFRKEAQFRESILLNGEWVDDLVYALLKDKWR
ncbi:MAG: GNAT family N-acetyltransferase [Bacteroidetes bacterium GWB2_41_8]|nr:MAG: GNAT family N-acetyltransferase [Bacteroidetes bacterium GWB2_41_8]